VGCGRCGGVGSLLTFDIPQTALVATLDTYDFIFKKKLSKDAKIYYAKCNHDEIRNKLLDVWTLLLHVATQTDANFYVVTQINANYSRLYYSMLRRKPTRISTFRRDAKRREF
jgi:hypothetical protein